MRYPKMVGFAVPTEMVPPELADLLDRLESLPTDIREELRPAVAEAIEQARYRARAMGIAKDALERLRVDLELTRFDLELTRRERDAKLA